MINPHQCTEIHKFEFFNFRFQASFSKKQIWMISSHSFMNLKTPHPLHAFFVFECEEICGNFQKSSYYNFFYLILPNLFSAAFVNFFSTSLPVFIVTVTTAIVEKWLLLCPIIIIFYYYYDNCPFLSSFYHNYGDTFCTLIFQFLLTLPQFEFLLLQFFSSLLMPICGRCHQLSEWEWEIQNEGANSVTLIPMVIIRLLSTTIITTSIDTIDYYFILSAFT